MDNSVMRKSSLVFALLVGVLALNVVTPVTSRSLQEYNDQKTYYSPKTKSSPKTSPSTGSSPSPSHGSGGSYESTPTPSHGSGVYGTPTPSHGSGGSSTPTVSTPSTPVIQPNLPPYFTGTCSYWGSHPKDIAKIIGYWAPISNYFGTACLAIFGKNLSLPDALTNSRSDGYGELFREGTAALLNSMSNSKFPFTTQQVKDAFAGSIASVGSAAAQASLFKVANEGNYKV